MNHAFTSKKLFLSLLENISVQRLGLFPLSLKFCNYKIIPKNFKGSDVVAFCYDFLNVRNRT